MTTTDANANTGASNESSDPLIGQTIADGKYRIVKMLGEGGMGKVYMGVQKLGDRDRSVAIKTLQPELAQDAQIVARFHREAGIVSLLEHPNTIKFYESGQLPDGKLFVAMEYIQGESLAHVITRGPLAPQRVEHILAQVCGSLAEAHEHDIVHRDLKPENIMLLQRGQRGDFVKVLDFGIAKRDESGEDAQHAKLTRQGMVLGTPPYMSPEQFTGKPLRATSDIYSLAIVAYEMITGQLPFQAATPWEWATRHLTAQPVPFESHPVAMNNPQHQKAAVMHALAKDPGARPQTTTRFLQEFTNNANAGNDWSQSTNSQPNAFGSAQNPPPSAFTPTPVPMGQPTPQPFGAHSHTGPGVAPTMAVGFASTPQPFQSNPQQPFQSNPQQPYQSGPQPFQATSNPGFVPAPTGSGLPAVPQQPSNPGFNPVQAPYNPYTSQPGGYQQQQQQQQQGGGIGKFIAIGAGLLVVAAIGIGVAVSSGNNSNNNSNNNGNNNNGNNTNNGNDPNNGNQANNPVINNPNTMQPVPNPNVLQPIPPNPNTMQPIPPNPNVLQPIPTPPPQQDPNENRRPERPAVPAVCRGGAGRIDDLILGGRCPAAQAAYRAMRAAGCLPRGADQSFGSACPRP